MVVRATRREGGREGRGSEGGARRTRGSESRSQSGGGVRRAALYGSWLRAHSGQRLIDPLPHSPHHHHHRSHNSLTLTTHNNRAPPQKYIRASYSADFLPTARLMVILRCLSRRHILLLPQADPVQHPYTINYAPDNSP